VLPWNVGDLVFLCFCDQMMLPIILVKLYPLEHMRPRLELGDRSKNYML
jgi:hypothetical protein